MPRISNSTPVLFTIATSLTPKMFRIVIRISVTIAMIRWLCRLFAHVPAHVVERRDQRQRQRHADGGDGEDAGEQVDPAGEPRVRLPGEVLRPLEDRAGDRDSGSTSSAKPSAMHELPERDERPAPDEDAADGRRGRARRA